MPCKIYKTFFGKVYITCHILHRLLRWFKVVTYTSFVCEVWGLSDSARLAVVTPFKSTKQVVVREPVETIFITYVCFNADIFSYVMSFVFTAGHVIVTFTLTFNVQCN